jgi:dCTP deaminase
VSVLAKQQIQEQMRRQDHPLLIVPLLEESQIGEASVDVRLGHEFIVLHRSSVHHVDPTEPDGWPRILNRSQEKVRISLHQEFIVHPGQLVLGATLEYLSLPLDISATVEGRSSWGRLGLLVATASTIGPGFKGCITLELVNAGEVPLALYPGQRVAQLVFQGLSSPAKYEGKYNCPTGPEFTRLNEDQDIAFWGKRK